MGGELPTSLRLFAALALTGELERPKRKGRPFSTGEIERSHQYSLVLLTHQLSGIPISRNDTSDAFSACDAVAQAWTNAGKYTTFAQIRSLCYDKPYSEIRALGSFFGDAREEFKDFGRAMRFSTVENGEQSE